MSDDFDDFDAFDERARRAARAIPTAPLGDGDVGAVRRRVRRSRGTAAAIASVLVVGIVATAIGVNATRDDQGLVIAGTSTTTAPLVADSGPDPILMMRRTCYGACAYAEPLDIPAVAIYRDGTVVAATRTQGENPRWVLTGTAARLSPTELERLLAQAAEAGLDAGGVHAAGDTTGTVDGGGTVFVAHLRGVDTVIEAPWLWSEEEAGRHGGDPRQRRALFTLSGIMDALAKRATTAVEPEGYVVVGDKGVIDYTVVRPPWPGRPLDSLLSDSLNGRRCGVVRGADIGRVAAVVDATGFGALVEDRGAKWQLTGRPLLPHEHTCADVATTMSRFRDEERSALLAGEPAPTTSTSSSTTTTPTPATTPLPTASMFPPLVVSDLRTMSVERVDPSQGVTGLADASTRVAFRISNGDVVGEEVSDVIVNGVPQTEILRRNAIGSVIPIPSLRGTALLGVGRAQNGHDLLFLRGPQREESQSDLLVHDLQTGATTRAGWATGGDSGFGRVSLAADRLLLSGSADLGSSIEHRRLDGSPAPGPALTDGLPYPNNAVSNAVIAPDGATIAYLSGPQGGTDDAWTLRVVDARSGARILERKVVGSGDSCDYLDYDGRWAVISRTSADGRVRKTAIVVDTQSATPVARQVTAAVGVATLDRS